MIRNKDMENSSGLMENNIEYNKLLRANGKVVSNMGLDTIQVQMVKKDRESGLMEKELNG